jgi:hypothetical protein
MIDLIVTRPHVSQGELAKVFGYSQAWVSTIMCSDAFKAKLAQRRDELVDPVLKISIEERIRAMTVRSLEVLQEKLAEPAMLVPDNLALKALELGAKGLGLGGNAPPPPPSADHLERMADRLVALQRGLRPVSVIAIEAEIIQ